MKNEWRNGDLDVAAFAENSYERRMSIDPHCDQDQAWESALIHAENYKRFIDSERAQAFRQMRFDEAEYQVAKLLNTMKANA